MPRISKRTKLWRVIKRKFLKPFLYAIGISILLYTVISNTVISTRHIKTIAPQFVISRLTNQFEETEFMHLLLTIQELERYSNEREELRKFVNTPTPGHCSLLFQTRLKQMNWTPEAFHIRVQTLFKMYDIYDRSTRLEETIEFLQREIKANNLPPALTNQVNFLQKQLHELQTKELTPQEFEFIKQYSGLVQKIKNLN